MSIVVLPKDDVDNSVMCNSEVGDVVTTSFAQRSVARLDQRGNGGVVGYTRANSRTCCNSVGLCKLRSSLQL